MSHYLGQPSPGATLPLPITGPGHPVPFGFCSCKRPADAIVRRLHQPNDEAICASCAHRLRVPNVIDLGALERLPAEFRTEEAMRAVRWQGTGLALARRLQDMGFTRRRTASGFTWLKRQAA